MSGEESQTPRRWMKWLHRLLIAAGLVAIVVLLVRLDARTALGTVAHAGWGILFIFALDLVPQSLNAFGWRLSFAPREARSYGMLELWKLWLSMDGVNYLVPTGTVAGEVLRAAMLSDAHPAEVRSASVVTSRFGHTVAQITVVLAGFVFFVSRVPLVRQHGWIAMASTILLVLVLVAGITYLFFGRRWIAAEDEREDTASGAPNTEPNTAPNDAPMARGLFRATSRTLRDYFAHCRLRFAGSVVVFSVTYLWGAFEAWWICRLIGVPVDVATALTIEALSIAIDGALFLVPAKIGTQELGKTAIFSMLGLPLTAGLAFGIVRHIREFFWAITGFSIYSVSKGRREKC